jgi:hypothetical protein
MAVVGTVGTAIDSGEARAKSKMSGWRTMRGSGRQRTQREGGRMRQGNRVVEDATRGRGRQREAIGWQRTQQEGGADNVRQLGGE